MTKDQLIEFKNQFMQYQEQYMKLSQNFVNINKTGTDQTKNEVIKTSGYQDNQLPIPMISIIDK